MGVRVKRRTFLRGLVAGTSVSLGLPVLEVMLNSSGDAWADGSDLPDRFGVWFWGNGVRPDYWLPSGSTNWSPSAALQPLADLVPYVSVVSGCAIKTATHPHHSGMTGIMTGQHYHQVGTTRDTIVTTFARQSVDQDAADWFEGLAPYRSLEVGVTRYHGTDEGSTFQHLSHNGPNNPNPSAYDPVALYQRLFTSPTGPQLDLARRSVLDAVHGQAMDLARDLGTEDRQRLQQHMDSIRTLETRLASEPGECVPIDEPSAVADLAQGEDIVTKNALMTELLVLALACDLTRSFSVQFSTAGSGVVWWQVGATDGHHSLCHFEALPQSTVQGATVATMEQLGVFLRRLRSASEGDGNLLDRCSILCTTELTDGYTHSNSDFPILIAGKGNGRLRGGVHYRGSDDNTSDAVLTALHGAGVALGSWGVDAGYTTRTISELLT